MLRPQQTVNSFGPQQNPVDDASGAAAAPTLTSRVEAARSLMRRAFVPLVDGLAELYALPLWHQSPPQTSRPVPPAPERSDATAGSSGFRFTTSANATSGAAGSARQAFPKVEERPCAFPAGKLGLFSAEPIAKQRVIGWYTGKIYMSAAALDAAHARYGGALCKETAYAFEVRDPKNPERVIYHIDAYEPEAPGGELCQVRLINHSKNHNCYFSLRKRPDVPEGVGVAVVAQQRIKAGEELLLFYGDDYHTQLEERFGAQAANDQRKRVQKRLAAADAAPSRSGGAALAQRPKRARKPKPNEEAAMADLLISLRGQDAPAPLKANVTQAGKQWRRDGAAKASAAQKRARKDNAVSTPHDAMAGVDSILAAAMAMAMEQAAHARPHAAQEASHAGAEGGAAMPAAQSPAPTTTTAAFAQAADAAKTTPQATHIAPDAPATTGQVAGVVADAAATAKAASVGSDAPAATKRAASVASDAPATAAATAVTTTQQTPQATTPLNTPWDRLWHACVPGPADPIGPAVRAAKLAPASLRTMMCRLASDPQHHTALEAILAVAHTPAMVSGVLTHLVIGADAGNEAGAQALLTRLAQRQAPALRAGMLHANAYAIAVAAEFSREATLNTLLDVLGHALPNAAATAVMTTMARFGEPAIVTRISQRLHATHPQVTNSYDVSYAFLEYGQLASFAAYRDVVGADTILPSMRQANASKSERKRMQAKLNRCRTHTPASVDLDALGQRFVQHAETTVARVAALVSEAKAADKLDDMLNSYLADAIVRAAYAGRHDIVAGMINNADIGQQRCAEALNAVPGYLDLAARGALEHDGLGTFKQVVGLASSAQSKRGLRDVASEMGDPAAIRWLVQQTPASGGS